MYKLFFDGCSKRNPGPAGAGAVIFKDDTELFSNSMYVGIETNNVAEYNGLILGLNRAIQENIKQITVIGDSLLIIQQMNGTYKVNDKLKPYFITAKNLETHFDHIIYQHAYRQQNKRADELANQGLLKASLIS